MPSDFHSFLLFIMSEINYQYFHSFLQVNDIVSQVQSLMLNLTPIPLSCNQTPTIGAEVVKVTHLDETK